MYPLTRIGAAKLVALQGAEQGQFAAEVVVLTAVARRLVCIWLVLFGQVKGGKIGA